MQRVAPRSTGVRWQRLLALVFVVVGATLLLFRYGLSSAPPAPPPTPESRYLSIAQEAAGPSIRTAAHGEGAWKAELLNVGEGPELTLTMPLNQALSNEQFVRLAKQRIGQVVNALFVSDPALVRVTVIGTFPQEPGNELPAVSLFVRHDLVPSWGSATVAELEASGATFDIKPRYQ